MKRRPIWETRPSISLPVISATAGFWVFLTFCMEYVLKIRRDRIISVKICSIAAILKFLLKYLNAFLHVLLPFLGRYGRHSVWNILHNAFDPYGNNYDKSHTALKYVNAILPVFSTFFVRFGYNSVVELSNKSYPVQGVIKIGAV